MVQEMGSVQVLCNIFQVEVEVEQILADQVLINQLVVQVVVDKDKVVLEVEHDVRRPGLHRADDQLVNPRHPDQLLPVRLEHEHGRTGAVGRHARSALGWCSQALVTPLVHLARPDSRSSYVQPL